MQFLLRIAPTAFSALLIIIVTSTFSTTAFSQRHAANVLYSDEPRPIRIGVEVGGTYTMFSNDAPTFFPIQYPYIAFHDLPDTVHLRFPDGSKGDIGLHLGVAADFSLSDDWGLLLKLNYNQRRHNWHGAVEVPCNVDTAVMNVPIINDYELDVRYLAFEAMARYAFASLHDFYLAGGFALNYRLSSIYLDEQTISTDADCSFQYLGTNVATGIKSYKFGGKLDPRLSSLLAEVKLLAGYPIHIGYRWTLNPEATFAYPINQMFNKETQDIYKREGLSAPNPLTFALILGLRYEL